MKALGVSAGEIDIKPAARQMLADIGHPFAKGEKVYDVTFENVQAGLRTDYLFRLANQHRGMVVGTGDLSELGLGWCTYGVGDHMSHYNPNGSVSKTLIQHLIRFVAASGDVDRNTADILHDILDTEISPELIPRRQRRGAGDRELRRALRAAGFQSLLPDAARLPAVEDRLPRLECLARRQEGRVARERAGSRRSAPIRWRRSIAGWSCSCGASSATSSSARRCPMDRRSRRAVRCRRAAIGVRPRTAAPMSGWQS